MIAKKPSKERQRLESLITNRDSGRLCKESIDSASILLLSRKALHKASMNYCKSAIELIQDGFLSASG